MADLIDIFGDDEDEELEPGPLRDEVVRAAESAFPANDLINDLIHWLENEKTEPPRAPGLHCSSLWKTCARWRLLEKIYEDKIVPEKLTAGSRMTFDEGHALHDLIQNVYLGPFGRLYGDWNCLNCQEIVFRGTMPQACPKCDVPWRNDKDGSQNIIYAELFVRHDTLGYCGHCDGILLGRDPSVQRVFEFKTISKSGYARLRRPKHAHVIQVHAYMAALGLTEAIVLYWDKASQCDWTRDTDGSWITGPPHLKAFHVKFDNKLWDEIVVRVNHWNEADKMVKTLPVVTTAEVMKFERICTNSTCDLAVECPVSSYCFKLPK